MACVWRRQLAGIVFYNVGLMARAQVVKLGGKYLHPLNHLISPPILVCEEPRNTSPSPNL